MLNCNPLYTTVDSVKVRLANKVQFQADPRVVADGELPNDLLLQIIIDAETEVEQDLRSRYAIPFVSKSKNSFAALPDHSKRAFRWAVDMRAVLLVLDTDFGRGTHINAEGYKESFEKHYTIYIHKLLGRDPEGANDKIDRFRRSPPLDDVLLSPTNREADDGYHGMIINTDASRHDAATYAGEQINNPAATYVGRRPIGGQL